MCRPIIAGNGRPYGNEMDYPKRKDNRLKEFDYSQNGAYFLTICVKDRKPVLSSIKKQDEPVGAGNARPDLSELTVAGMIVEKAILSISEHYPGVFVDDYVIMPNHVHMILRLDHDAEECRAAPAVSRIIQQFKGTVAKQSGIQWQKSFHDHIIRNEVDYLSVYDYIENNPARWAEDELNDLK